MCDQHVESVPLQLCTWFANLSRSVRMTSEESVSHFVFAVVTATICCGGWFPAQVAAEPPYAAIVRPLGEPSSAGGVPELASTPDQGVIARWNDALQSGSDGIQFAPMYYADLLTNTRGGRSTNDATQYLGLMDLPVWIDFERVGLFLPGRAFLRAQNTHGRGLTTDFVGDSLVVSDIDSFRNIMQVSEYWWEVGAADGPFRLRVGKQDVNSEFIHMELATDFVQSSFELTPTAVLPTYPHPAMAAVALCQIEDSVQLKLGVWDALATGGGWGISGTGTYLLIGELEYHYTLGDRRLPGSLSTGAAYLTHGEVGGEQFGAVQGFSFQLEQAVFQEDSSGLDAAQGLAVFAAYYPRFRDAPVLSHAIGTSVAAGVVYTGLLTQRDQDVLGAGLSSAELFQGGTNRESVVELFYKAQLTPRFSIQPDLQYIATPSGIYRDSLVVGVRVQLGF
jgi:porin